MAIKKIFILTLFCIYFIFGCASDPKTIESYISDQDALIESYKPGKTLYTAYNLWYEPGKEKAMWCINYKTGNFIPAGTEVRNVGLSKSMTGRKAGAELLALSFVTVEDGKKYWVNFTKRFHFGKTIHDYLNIMFSEKTFTQLTKGMSETEIMGIKKGVLIEGMSKKSVIVSYGYPPEHRTPSLQMNVWIYWMNRFRSKKIHFDSYNRTIAPPKTPGIL